MAFYGITEAEINDLVQCVLEILDGYHWEGACTLLKTNPQALLTEPRLNIDWKAAAERYPNWIKMSGTRSGQKKTVTFHGSPPPEVVPLKVTGRIVSWTLSVKEIRHLSSSCNDNQSFQIEYTPFDQLQTVGRVLEEYLESDPSKKTITNVQVLALNLLYNPLP